MCISQSSEIRGTRRGAEMNSQVRRSVIFLVACASFFLACHCQAKDWDLERAQYRTDAQISELRGPVRSLRTYSYSNGSLKESDKVEFDKNGNLVRRVGILYNSPSCFESTFANDASGNRVRESETSGKPNPGDIECQNQSPFRETTHTYDFNDQGLPTFRKSLVTLSGITGPDERKTRYSYDSAGRLIKIDSSSGTTVTFYEYSYGSDPRGIRVRKRSYYSNGHTVFDVKRELLYATGGRLLEATQSPSNVFGFPGNTLEVYDGAGRLIQEKGSLATTNY